MWQGLVTAISIKFIYNGTTVKGTTVKLYTYMNVREDAINLYGFLTKDQLEIFKLLITVSGIGPKVAIGMLSALSPDDIRFAVLGKKTLKH